MYPNKGYDNKSRNLQMDVSLTEKNCKDEDEEK